MEEEIDYTKFSLGALQEVIGELENAPPKDKRKKEYKEYIDRLNWFFKLYNTKAGEKVYRIIK